MFLNIILMTILASVERSLISGDLSIWDFCQKDDRYFARGRNGGHVRCSDRDDLRRLYKRMIGYGFFPRVEADA